MIDPRLSGGVGFTILRVQVKMTLPAKHDQVVTLKPLFRRLEQGGLVMQFQPPPISAYAVQPLALRASVVGFGKHPRPKRPPARGSVKAVRGLPVHVSTTAPHASQLPSGAGAARSL